MKDLVSFACLLIVALAVTAGEPSAQPQQKVVVAGPLKFAETRLLSKYTYSYAVVASDLDGDGDLDITSSDAEPNSQLYLLLNDGKGNFERSFIQKYRGDPDQPVRLERHAHGDVNGDGRPDVVIVDNLRGDLRWFEHPGNEKIAGEWKLHRVAARGEVPGSYDVALSDLDGDGDLDVAAAAGWKGGHNFYWFENLGNARAWQRHEIDAGVSEARTIVAADFNGDGKPDLLGSSRSGNEVMWYENDGTPRIGPWTKHLIDDATGAPTHGHAVDLDKDGDLDVIMAFGTAAAPRQLRACWYRAFLKPLGIPPRNPRSHQIAWYENVGRPGLGTEWKKHLVLDDFSNGFEVVAGDLDRDKDLDLVATGWTANGRIGWIENTGDPKAGWKYHELRQPWTKAVTVILGDFNGDTRLDIAAAAGPTDNEIRWWRNDGRGRAAYHPSTVSGDRLRERGIRVVLDF